MLGGNLTIINQNSMKKSAAVFAIALSLGLYLPSCGRSQDIVDPIATSTAQETSISIQPPVFPTPTLNNIANGNGGLTVTLGETVNRQGWWPAIPAFSPDGKMLVLASERVRLWDLETHTLIHEFTKPYSDCYTENVAFSTDGTLLAVSIDCLSDSNPTGHALIWDTKSGDMLHDWEQHFSKNTSKPGVMSNSLPATGLAFLPKSSSLAFANGNTIEIRDVRGSNKPVVLELSDKMLASDIAISDNGKLLFAFMDFSYYKTPNRIGQKYALQVWNLESESIRERTDFPEPGNTGSFMGHFDVEIKLSDKFLINIDYINGIFKVTNLETGNTKNLNYRGDVKAFISQDANYVAYLPKFDGFDCRNQGIELWETGVNSSLYTFKTSDKDFGTEWCHSPNTIIFSPDNTVLAIAHEERVSLWDISSFTKPKKNAIP
jgi:WD40 repeat protein